MSDLKDDTAEMNTETAVGATDVKPADKPGDWMEQPQTLANGVHALIGYGVLLTVVLLTHRSPNVAAWVGGVQGALAIFVLAKEYFYDLREETGETMRSSTIDALGYLVGNVVAWGVWGLAWRMGVWP